MKYFTSKISWNTTTPYWELVRFTLKLTWLGEQRQEERNERANEHVYVGGDTNRLNSGVDKEHDIQLVRQCDNYNLKYYRR